MSAPQFQKSGMTTLTFSRTYILPVHHTYRPRQRVGRSESGIVKVVTFSDPDEQWTLSFRGLTATDYANLLAWFQHPSINWGENSFTFVDHNAASHTVRYLDGEFDMPEIVTGVYEVTLTLLKEPRL